MSKSLRSYPESERKNIIRRRLEQHAGGLGYWAAVDSQNPKKEKPAKEEKTAG